MRRGGRSAAGARDVGASHEPGALPLGALLEVQRAARAPDALADSLGDAFLLEHNGVFRRLRAALLAAGYSVVPSSAVPWDYANLVLVSLPEIYARKLLPYFPNVRAAEHLEASRPGAFTVGDLLAVGCRPNFVLHESAHALAHEHLARVSWRSTSGKPQLLVLAHTIESLACAVDVLGAAEIDGALHRAFYELNSNILPRTRERVDVLARGVAALGPELAFVALFLGFFHANLLVTEASAAAIDEALAAFAAHVPVAARQRRAAREVFRLALTTLSAVFHLRTSALFFKHAGIDGSARELLAIEPAGVLAAEPELMGAVAAFARGVVGGFERGVLASSAE